MAAYQFRFDVLDKLTKTVNGFAATFARAQGSAQGFVDTTKKMQSVGNVAGMGLMKLNAGVQLFQTAVSALSQPIEVFTEFEKTATVLEAKLGKGGMTQAMQDLTKFANENGQAIAGVEDSFLNLVNRGFTPTIQQMQQLTDFSLSSKKPINQYVEAILDMQTGEAERLKEFGVRVEKINGKFAMTFNKSTQMIGQDADSVMNYLLKLGDLDGTKGLGEKWQIRSVAQLRRCRIILEIFEVQIMGAFAPLLNDVLPVVSDALGGVGAFFRDNKEGISSFVGEIKTSFMAVVNFVKPLFETLKPIAVGLFNLLSNAFNQLKGFLIANEGNLAKIRDTIGWLTQKIGAVLIPLLDVVHRIVVTFFDLYVKYIGFVIDMWTALGNAAISVFTWIGEKVTWFGGMFLGIMNNIFPGFRDAFQKTKDWLYNTFIKPIADWFGALFKFDVGVTNTTQEIIDTSTGKKTVGKIAENAAKGNSPVQDKLDSIKGDGNKMTNVNIRIDKLNDGGIQVITNNFRESEAQLKAFFERLLMDAVNQANYAN